MLGSRAIPGRPRLTGASWSWRQPPRDLALTNNRYSADVIAVAARSVLGDVPDLATDNMPRWLEERAGIRVADRREQRRLGVDIDGLA